MKAYDYNNSLHKMLLWMIRKEFERKEHTLRKMRDGREDNG